MSTLEQSIADLTTQTGLLLDLPQEMANEASQQISSITNEYINRISKLEITRTVDQINGLDSNPGTEALPHKTIRKSVDDCPLGGKVTIRLAGDYQMTEDVNIRSKHVFIQALGTVRYAIKFNRYTYTNVNVDYRAVKGFNLFGVCNLTFEGVTLVVPPNDGNWPLLPQEGVQSHLIRSAASYYSEFVAVKLSRCDLSIPTDAYGSIVSIYYTLSLSLQSVVATDQPLLGRLLRGQTNTSGTDVNTIPGLLCNLATI